MLGLGLLNIIFNKESSIEALPIEIKNGNIYSLFLEIYKNIENNAAPANIIFESAMFVIKVNIFIKC
jgi:hypothetical protein